MLTFIGKSPGSFGKVTLIPPAFQAFQVDAHQARDFGHFYPGKNMEKPWKNHGPMTHLSTVSTLPAFSPFRQKTTSVAVSGQLLLRYSAAARCTWVYLGDEPR
jgi:hypothetical protein